MFRDLKVLGCPLGLMITSTNTATVWRLRATGRPNREAPMCHNDTYFIKTKSPWR